MLGQIHQRCVVYCGAILKPFLAVCLILQLAMFGELQSYLATGELGLTQFSSRLIASSFSSVSQAVDQDSKHSPDVSACAYLILGFCESADMKL